MSLDIAGTGDGAFNGDYYAELVNGAGGFAVLLNRAGVSSANSFGYGDNGFNVTLNDTAAQDIHFCQFLLRHECQRPINRHMAAGRRKHFFAVVQPVGF